MKSAMMRQISLSGPKVVARRAVARPSRQCGLTVRAALTAKTSLDINTMQPLGERVLLKPMENEQKTEGGILLPSSATEQHGGPKFGEVISVGEEAGVELKKGDKVIYVDEGVSNVDVSEGEIVFISDKSILATMR